MINIASKYYNFANRFLSDFVVKLLKYTCIINYLINLANNKQPSHSLIYCLELVELEILKTYIETNY